MFAGAILTVAAMMALAGCSTTAAEENDVALTLEQAKAQVWEVESEIVALVPESAITERYPHAETSAVLFECDDPDTYNWPGGTQLAIDPATDSGAIVQEIHDAWAEDPDWELKWVSDGADGVFHLDMYRTDGLHFAVMNLEGNTVLDISAFSPCFVLTDYDPLQSY